jgi:NTP pyrophosphatase (non-canonical NTP hydrolase)
MLKELRQANKTRAAEWGAEGITLSYRGNELAGEVGEACNLIKKLDRERLGYVGTRASLQELIEELADVIICVDLIAMDLGVELEDEVKAKFNKTSSKYGLETRLG